MGRQEPPRITLSRREAASALGISTDSLDRLVAAGELRCIRRGRLVLIATRELEAWAQRSQARTIER